MINFRTRGLSLGAFLFAGVTSLLSFGPSAGQQSNHVIPLKGSTDQAMWAIFSADKKYVAASSKHSEIKIWDVASGQVKTQMLGRGIGLVPAAFSADGTLLAAVAHHATVRIWEVASGKEKQTLKGDAEMVLAQAFSPRGKYLATANTNDTVTLWELASGREKTLRGHSSSVFCVAFSGDGKLLASGSRDGTVRLWDVASGAEKTCLKEQPGAITNVVFSGDGRFLVSNGWDVNRIASESPVIIWDLPSGQERTRLKGCWSQALSDDGKFLATIAAGSQTLQVWETGTAKLNFTHKLTRGGTALATTFSSDGTLVAVVKEDSQLKLQALPFRAGRTN